MLKSIPQSNISEKRFYVYKEWEQSHDEEPVLHAFSETGSGAFNAGTATLATTSSNQPPIYSSPLWHSVKTRYYTNTGVFTQAGLLQNPARFNLERQLTSELHIVDVPQLKYGEQIKRHSVVLEILNAVGSTGSIYYYDDSFGGMRTENPIYNFISYDAETQDFTFFDSTTSSNVVLVLSFFDVNTGIGTFSYNGDTGNYTVLQVDFNSGFVQFSDILDFNDLTLNTQRVGNVFYDDGLIVLTNGLEFTEYRLTYRSMVEIKETEVLVSVKQGEFNTSQNPTAVNVTLFSSQSFETTPIRNGSPGGPVLIKEVLDISKKQYFVGSYSSSISGSWDDYLESGSIDPTGSYLTPYVTTIGLYDDNYDMVAVAKLPTPIKNLPDYDLNFIVRFDT
jgi:hypothetical protein